MIQIIFATNPLFFSSLRQTPKFNHIEGLIVGMLTLTPFSPVYFGSLDMHSGGEFTKLLSCLQAKNSANKTEKNG